MGFKRDRKHKEKRGQKSGHTSDGLMGDRTPHSTQPQKSQLQRAHQLQSAHMHASVHRNKDQAKTNLTPHFDRRTPSLHDRDMVPAPPLDDFGESPDMAVSELGTHLLFSAQSIEKNNETLSQYSKTLNQTIHNRIASEARLATQSLRLAIGSIWLMIAFLLYMNVHQRGKDGIFAKGLGSQMPIEHASGLSSLFLIVSLPVIILAIVSAVYIWNSTADNSRIRQAAENLGLYIASVAHKFDEQLDGFIRPHLQNNRDQNNRSGRQVEHNLSDTAEGLSRAHLTAVEVQLFFRKLKFMNAKTRKQAILDLQGFLKNNASGGHASPHLILFIGMIIGAIITTIIFSITGEKSTPPESTGSLPDILLYPSYFMTLFFGALLFLLAGLICNFLIPSFKSVRRKALDDALDATRGAYTGDNAPRFHEIIRRIEEALSAYQARIDDIKTTTIKNQTKLAQQQQTNLPNTPKDVDLEWRHRDTAAQFVETGFQSIPRPFKDKSTPSGESASTSPARSVYGTHQKSKKV